MVAQARCSWLWSHCFQKRTKLAISHFDPCRIEVGAAVQASGELAHSPGSKQTAELHVDRVSVLGPCPGEVGCARSPLLLIFQSYPIQNKELSPDMLRTIPHLRPRSPPFASLMVLRSGLIASLRAVLQAEQCHEVHAPTISFSDCEGGGEAFKIEQGGAFFGKDAFLTVSAQLHAELAALALGRVYTFGPVFRAEKHHTSRHLAEFSMLEVEMSFIDDIHGLMDAAESTIRGAVARLSQDHIQAAVSKVGLERRAALLGPYARMSYTKAIEELQGAQSTSSHPSFSNPVRWGLALQTEHERFLAEKVVGGPVFIHDYPAPIKAFYMKSNRTPELSPTHENGTVACFDLLLPQIGEVAGGSVREDRLDFLTGALQRFGLSSADYEWYLDLRRYGSAPHGGFGLGFDRLLQYLTATANIRDVVMVPRSRDSAIC